MAMGVIRSHLHRDVVAGHNHLNALGQLDGAGNVGRAEVELRTVAGEERGMTAAFFLGQYVNLALELGVGVNGAGLGHDLAALDVGALYAAEQYADVVARDGLIQQLAEHFYAGYYGAALLVRQTDDLDGILYLYGAALYTAGGDGAAAGDARIRPQQA